jgi:hypothetical protein
MALSRGHREGSNSLDPRSLSSPRASHWCAMQNIAPKPAIPGKMADHAKTTGRKNGNCSRRLE